MIEGPHMAGFSPVISRYILSMALASLRRVLSSTASMKAATDALVFLVFGSGMGGLHHAPILITTLVSRPTTSGSGYCASSTSTQSDEPVLLLPGVASRGVLPEAANGDPEMVCQAPLVGSYQRARTLLVLKPPRLTRTSLRAVGT